MAFIWIKEKKLLTWLHKLQGLFFISWSKKENNCQNAYFSFKSLKFSPKLGKDGFFAVLIVILWSYGQIRKAHNRVEENRITWCPHTFTFLVTVTSWNSCKLMKSVWLRLSFVALAWRDWASLRHRQGTHGKPEGSTSTSTEL